MSQQLLEDISRAYLGAKIQGVHLNNYHQHGLSYNHHRDVEQKLGLVPSHAAPPPQPNVDMNGATDRLGISPFPAHTSSRYESTTTESSATNSGTKKSSKAPLIAATVGSLLLGTLGGAIGSKMLTPTPAVDPPAVVAPTNDLPPVSQYEMRSGQVDLEVR